MGVLQRFERRIEEMVNRPFARAFKAEVQPVEIASALQRETDDRAAIVARGRTMVPNAFTVVLGPHDHERLSTYAEALGSELASMVSEHAEEQHYAFLGPVTVTFERDERPGDRSVPGPQRGAGGCRSRRSQPGQQGGPDRAPLARGRRHDVRADADRRPASAAATTPTCASMTRASPATTPRSASRAAT